MQFACLFVHHLHVSVVDALSVVSTAGNGHPLVQPTFEDVQLLCSNRDKQTLEVELYFLSCLSNHPSVIVLSVHIQCAYAEADYVLLEVGSAKNPLHDADN